MEEQTLTQPVKSESAETEASAHMEQPDARATSDPLAVMGDFVDPNEVTDAARAIHAAGYTDFDIYTPYPVHGLEKAMGMKKTILPFFSLGGALFGLGNAIFLQWWTGTLHYPLNIGGKPFFSPWFGMPVMFELTVLLCALTTAVVMFGLLCKLPQWHNPFQKDAGFRRAVDDTFVVVIEAKDQRFTVDSATNLLEKLGASNVRLVNV